MAVVKNYNEFEDGKELWQSLVTLRDNGIVGLLPIFCAQSIKVVAWLIENKSENVTIPHVHVLMKERVALPSWKDGGRS